MALALNNLKRVDMPLKKETKPNQTIFLLEWYQINPIWDQMVRINLWECFHWSLSDSKYLHVSRTLLSIQTNFKYAVVWIVSTRPLVFKFSSPCTNPLVTVPRASITIGIVVYFMFQSFFSFLARSSYLSLFSPFFNFTLWNDKVHYSAGSLFFSFFFLVTISRSVRLAKSRRSVCISKFGRIFLRSKGIFAFPDYYYYYYYYNYYTFSEFLTPALAVGLYQESEGQQVFQVSRTLLSILAYLSHTIVSMVSIHH